MSVRRSNFVVHPFFFAAFPVVSLAAVNANTIDVWEIGAPLVLTELLVAAAWLAGWALLRDVPKSGLVAAGFVLAFFAYGDTLTHLRDALGMRGMAGGVALAVSVAVLLAGGAVAVFWLRQTGRSFIGLTRFLNVFSVVAVCVAVATFVSAYSWGSVRSERLHSRPISENDPDIFYFVLDGYGRADVLAELYGTDDAFAGDLESKGFFVVDDAFANYCRTIQSLSSTLNWTYVQDMAAYRENGDIEQAIWGMVRENRAISTLRERGYRVAAFSTGFGPTELKDADLYSSPPSDFSAFEARLIDMTPIRSILNRIRTDFLYYGLRERIRYTLHNVDSIPTNEGPWFVFAHVLAPHPPFVLDADGGSVTPDRRFTHADGNFFYSKGGTPEEYREGYSGQVAIVTEWLQDAIDAIISRSPDAVIVVQGDHGPGLKLDWHDVEKTDVRERMGILYAVRAPGAELDELAEHPSPVNLFPALFNAYFGESVALQPDRSYFSTDTAPFAFIDVTDRVSEPKSDG